MASSGDGSDGREQTGGRHRPGAGRGEGGGRGLQRDAWGTQARAAFYCTAGHGGGGEAGSRPCDAADAVGTRSDVDVGRAYAHTFGRERSPC